MIIRLTAAAVVLLAATNAAQSAWLAVRLATLASSRVPRLGTRMWLPRFASCAEVREWCAAWRTVFTCQDAALVALRLEARTVVVRYLALVIGSNGWAIAVWVVLMLPLA